MKKILATLITLIVVFSMFSTFAPKAKATSLSPVGCWELDESSGNVAHDSSENSNHGTVYGASWVSGKSGSALSFDGQNDYVEVLDSPSLNPSFITVMAWVKYNGFWNNPNDRWCCHSEIVCKGTDDRISGFYGLGEVDLAYSGGSGHAFQFLLREDAVSYSVRSSTHITLGVWYHVAATYDGNLLKMYVNGALEDEKAVSVSRTSNSGSLQIGAQRQPRYEYWTDGVIDEVKIYNYARTAEEIWNDWIMYGPAVRAWKDEASFGLENDHLLLYGDNSKYVGGASPHYMSWFKYLVFKDTGTIWTSPWDDIFLLYAPDMYYADVGSVQIEAFTEIDEARIIYHADIPYLPYVVPGPVHIELTITIRDGPYIYWTAKVTNTDLVQKTIPIALSLYTFIAGDTANDYYYVPGHGQGQFIGTQKNINHDPSESWAAVWDEAKQEGCGIVTTQGFSDLNVQISDWYALTAVPEMVHLGEGLEGITIAPGETSPTYDCYYYFFTGTGWQKTKTFYDSIVQPKQFDPRVDGFGFNNYGRQSVCMDITIKQLYDEMDYIPVPAQRVLLAIYAFTLGQLQHDAGHCYGISRVAVHYFTHHQELKGLLEPLGLSAASQVSSYNLISAIREKIEYEHVFGLWGNPNLYFKKLIYILESPFPGLPSLEAEVNDIVNTLDSQGYAFVSLYGTDGTRSGFHSVVAYDGKYDALSDTYTIHFYDSNWQFGGGPGSDGSGHKHKIQLTHNPQGKLYISDDGDSLVQWYDIIIHEDGSVMCTWEYLIPKVVDWLLDHLGELWDALLEFASEAPELWNQFIEWILNYVKDLWNEIVKLSLSCPAELHIYNAIGDHVGLTPAGGIEIGFPALFFVAGDTLHAILVDPNAGDYRIEVVGTGSGSFVLKFSSIVNGTTTSEKTISGEIKEGETKTYQISYKTSGELTTKEAFPLWILGAVAAVMVVIVATLVLWKRRKPKITAT